MFLPINYVLGISIIYSNKWSELRYDIAVSNTTLDPKIKGLNQNFMCLYICQFFFLRYLYWTSQINQLNILVFMYLSIYAFLFLDICMLKKLSTFSCNERPRINEMAQSRNKEENLLSTISNCIKGKVGL